jgi:CheY-like chemotaxis protein
VSPALGLKIYEEHIVTTTISQHRCAVLVVEDEWLLAMDLVDALEGAGFEVKQTDAAEDALLELADGSAIDVLVTDIRLAGAMTGWDLAEAYRSLRPQGGVIYASANAPLPNRQVAGSAFYAKPAAMSELIDDCQRLCAAQRRG